MKGINIHEFANFLFYKRGRSSGGIKTALSLYHAINGWFITKHKDYTPVTVEEFFITKRDEGLAISTLHSYKTIFHLLELFSGEKLMPEIKLPEVKRKIPYILSTGEITRLLSTTLAPRHYGNTSCEPLEYAYKVLTEFLYFSGARIEEALSLTVKQLLGDSLVHFDKTKFNIERIIYLFPPCYQKLAELSEGNQPDELVFQNMKGHKIHGVEYRKNLKLRVVAAGIPASIHPHSLRHTIATHLAQSDVDVRVVQKLLGHKSLDSTIYYEQFNLSKMRDGIYMLPLAQPYLSPQDRIERVLNAIEKLHLGQDARLDYRLEKTIRNGKHGLVFELFEK